MIEKLSIYDFTDTVTKRDADGYDKVLPASTHENMQILLDKINELVENINKISNTIKIKVFEFDCGKTHYAYAALTKENAIDKYNEDKRDNYITCTEIQENEWDKKMINYIDKKTGEWSMCSIRESINGINPHLVFIRHSY